MVENHWSKCYIELLFQKCLYLGNMFRRECAEGEPEDLVCVCVRVPEEDVFGPTVGVLLEQLVFE